MKFHVDRFDWFGAVGWAFGPRGSLIIEAWAAGHCIGSRRVDGARPDVAAAHPDEPLSAGSGFYLSFQLPAEIDEVEISLKIRNTNETQNKIDDVHEIGRKWVLNPFHLGSIDFHSTGPHDIATSSFPKQITTALAALWPDLNVTQAPEGMHKTLISKIGLIASQLALSSPSVTPVVGYFKFLRSVWSHFQFVAHYFPKVNLDKAFTDKDWDSTPNTPDELMSIAHQLYVLRSYGVEGDLAEFGCFKGYSSAMLSYACSLLGIRLHIFDSFAGLPPSESRHYNEGEFCGSLDEVRRNVALYGSPEAVEYHPGYFSQSIPANITGLPKFAAIWMDVDLFSSANDVMMITDKLDIHGAIFSHECQSSSFTNGHVVGGPVTPENVVAAIVGHFERLNIPIAGRFIAGCTGAFWRKHQGIPVLANEELMSLLRVV
ncbi:MAG: TylF/MycF/NovP-related O-methyltransferase [Xanthobacteraceae bacterium]